MQLRGLARWFFFEPLAFWLAFVVPLVSLFVAWFLPTSQELSVRIAGYFLTLLGIVMVVKGVRDKRVLFERPSVFRRTQAWLLRLPSFFGRSEPRSITLHTSSGGIAFGGSAHMTFEAGSNAPLEQRVLALERNLDGLGERFSAAEKRMGSQMQQFQHEHRRDIEEMKATDERLQHRLEQLSVGSLDFELAAVAWVLFGTFYTTFPQELAQCVSLFVARFGS